MDEELKKLRKKKIEQLKKQSSEEDEGEEREKQLEAQKKQILRSILTSEARQRLGRIKVARPQIAESIENQLIMQARSGRINNKITDKQLKQILSKIMPKKRDINIRRK